jgi:hypothetical protein
MEVSLRLGRKEISKSLRMLGEIDLELSVVFVKLRTLDFWAFGLGLLRRRDHEAWRSDRPADR